MYNSIKDFFLASFSEEEMDTFIKDKQEAKDLALTKLNRKVMKKVNHSRTFHSVVSAVKQMDFPKATKQSLVSDWLEEAIV